MKILGWISNTAVNGIAVVEVDANEIADVENMLALVDGDCVGHFGVSVKLIGTNGFNIQHYIIEAKRSKFGDAQSQFGYDHAAVMKAQKRYYKVFVDRD